jgi:hypothetical protein
MVYVRMRDDDLFDLKIVFLNEREDVCDVVSGIDHHRFQ